MLFASRIKFAMHSTTTRRAFCRTAATALAGLAAASAAPAAVRPGFRLRYVLASSMYGELPLAEVLPAVKQTGAQHIDLWPRKHGSQREQMDELGHDKFAAMLKQHGVRLGMTTRYDLGPFKLQEEMKVCQKFGASLIVTGASGPKGLQGAELKSALEKFVEQMRPHVEAAEESGLTIAIENHGNALVDSPDSIRWLAEMSPSPHLGIALAPYHLPDDAAVVAQLIRDIGGTLVHFYAWQHGNGCMKPMPKDEELLQMPGRGKLDFTPIIAALKAVDYNGWTSIFMHPTPRGIPILPTAKETTVEINRARDYLEACARKA
jgi:sugar phosphate isomerase/epimerase